MALLGSIDHRPRMHCPATKSVDNSSSAYGDLSQWRAISRAMNSIMSASEVTAARVCTCVCVCSRAVNSVIYVCVCADNESVILFPMTQSD